MTDARIPAAEADLGLHDPLAESFPSSLQGRLLFWIAVAFSLYQIAISAHLIGLNSQVQRAIHLGFLLLLGVVCALCFRRKTGRGRVNQLCGSKYI